MTASSRLTTVLAPLWGPQGCAELDALADRAFVSHRIARMAARGRAVSVSHHLRLAVALGFDPFIEGRAIEPFQIGTFHKARFGEVVRHIRTERAMGIREGAKTFGVSIRALSFIENGHDTGIDTVLTVCRAIGIHPFLFCRNCFTADTSRNSLIQKAAA